jgi:hypothetical protein
MRRLLFLLSLLATLLLMSVAGPVFAGSQPLPPLPPQWLVNKVISETGGPTFTPVGVPSAMNGPLVSLDGALNNIENNLDYWQGVNYFGLNEFLYETVVPITNARFATLAPNMTAPGSPSAPGMIIGATYQRGRGVMAVVATFPTWTATIPNEIRFYFTSTQFHTALPIVGRFNDPDGDGVVDPADAGAVISDRFSCITIGLRQVCWQSYSNSQVRDTDAVRSLLVQANSQAQNRYNFSATFALWDAVPDIIGTNRRQWCRSDFGWKTLTEQMQGCQPNLAFVHASSASPGQPIGLWVVRNWSELKAYDMTGGYWGWLPPNQYLVMDATPHITQPGQVGVLMLVAINGDQHFVIPSNVMQSFGQGGGLNPWEAAIKDGMLRSRGF